MSAFHTSASQINVSTETAAMKYVLPECPLHHAVLLPTLGISAPYKPVRTCQVCRHIARVKTQLAIAANRIKRYQKLATAGVLLLALAVTAENETKCQALRDLNSQYLGTVLSPHEQVIKTQMISWYKANCQPAKKRR